MNDDFKNTIDIIEKSILDSLPDDKTILLADKGELEEFVYLATIFLADLETNGDVNNIAEEFGQTVRELQIELFKANHKFQEDGTFRTTVQSAGVNAGISNQKLLKAMNNPYREYTPH